MAFIRAKLGSSNVITASSSIDNPYNEPKQNDKLYDAASYELGKGGEKQQWNYIPVPGLPGVYKIQSNVSPTLYITTPASPKLYDLVYLDTEKKESDGTPSKTQLWILELITPDLSGKSTGYPFSVIQNYSSTGFVIDCGNGDTSKPLQLYYRRNNSHQSFYNDLSSPQ